MKLASRTTIAALVLAIAGLALPAAQAATRPDDRAGIRGIEASTSVRPDDRAGIRGIGQTSAVIDSSDVVSRYLRNRTNDTSDVVSRYVSNRTNDTSDVVSRYVANVLRSNPPQAVRPDDRAGVLGPGNEAASAQQTTLVSSNGFDWSVALIGAGGALAIVLLLGATGMGIVRHRHSHLKSA